MNKKLIPLLLASSSLLIACNEETTSTSTTPASTNTSATTAPTVNKEDAVAVVNGKYIAKADLQSLEAEIAQRAYGQKFPQEQLVEELIRRELLVQDAKQKKLDQTADFKKNLAMAERSLLSQASLQDYLKANPITEADLKAEYDKEIGKSAGTEYKARHILLKEKDAAAAIIAELGKGKDFAEMAKTHSTGPSKTQGGDLGWFTEDRMVKEFSDAVKALKNGEVTQEPIETQFGWHVILREDSREQTPPPFESVKEQIRPVLQQQKIQQMLENLEKQAKIEVLLEPETPAPAPAATPVSDKNTSQSEQDSEETSATSETEKTVAEPTSATTEEETTEENNTDEVSEETTEQKTSQSQSEQETNDTSTNETAQ